MRGLRRLDGLSNGPSSWMKPLTDAAAGSESTGGAGERDPTIRSPGPAERGRDDWATAAAATMSATTR